MGWQDDAVVAAAPKAVEPWERDAVVSAPTTLPAGASMLLRQHFDSPNTRGAKSFGDYLDAGWQQSVSGLASRGKVPEVAIVPDTPWYGRAVAGVAGLAGDAPAMLAGGLAVTVATGGRAGPVGIGAATFAAPMAIRAALMDSYEKGGITSASEFIDRAMHVAWEGTKGAVVGAATALTGGAVSALVQPGSVALAKGVAGAVQPVFARTAAVATASELATMTIVGRALEGQLPEAQDFMDAAILLGGLKGAGAAAGKLRTIYAKTGVGPQQVLADAAVDPTVKTQLLEGKADELPAAYEPIAERETARAVVPEEHALKIEQVIGKPFGEVPTEKQPNYLNFTFIDRPEQVKAASARISEVFADQIEEARGKESWQQTYDKTVSMLEELAKQKGESVVIPDNFDAFKNLAAKSMATVAMSQRASFDLVEAAKRVQAEGETPENLGRLAEAIETSALTQAVDQGAGAEIARALAARKAAKQTAALADKLQEFVGKYGSDPMRLAKMIGQIDTVEGVNKFAALASKANTWEKVVEAWKAGILSGPVTHMANMMGNTMFAAIRPGVDLVAAGFGTLRGGKDKVYVSEALSRVIGLGQGVADGLRMAGEVLRTEEQLGKSEQFRPAIGGMLGKVVRLPFRFLSAEDALFKTMNERGELYAQASHAAIDEGLSPLTREFRERVVSLVQNPTEAMQESASAAAERFTFNTKLGEFGQKISDAVRTGWFGTNVAPLQMVIPFIRTPMNILEELSRMTPFAPLVKGWREDYKAGGAARDRALAELTIGASIGAWTVSKALNGTISGAGEPDAGKKRGQSDQWQPYSIKIGGTWYNYQRLQPLGTLVGMAADMAEVWDHMTDEEKDKTPKMIATAFANAVTNQTFLQGITNVVNATSDPTRFGPRLVQQFAGSVVPAIIAQPTQMLDPVAREVNSVFDAIKARIPGLRQDLAPKLDIFGEPVQTRERLGVISPITELAPSSDKVRQEAARLGISVADAPKKTHLGRGTGKLGDVELTPEERHKFAEVGGKMAHEIMSDVVSAPGWESLPDLVQKRMFDRVFKQAHKIAASQALSGERRDAAIQQITEKVTEALTPEEVQ